MTIFAISVFFRRGSRYLVLLGHRTPLSNESLYKYAEIEVRLGQLDFVLNVHSVSLLLRINCLQSCMLML